uniref:HAT C-terminal dimerisation domain-containing protein n=1 Tax=Ditylenchus dipsaci TaxID=166011 RepID=A0A915CZN8_9BILA
MKYLSAPATSVASESILSLVRKVYDYMGANLDPKKVDMIMFLNYSLPLLYNNNSESLKQLQSKLCPTRLKKVMPSSLIEY